MVAPGQPRHQDGTGAPDARARAPRRAAPRRRWPRRVIGLLTVLVLLPLLLALGALYAAWESLHTESGTRWWLTQAASRVPGLVLGASRGALLGADANFILDSLSVQAGRTHVRVDVLRIKGLQLDQWQLAAPFVHVLADSVQARAVDVSRAPNKEASTAPIKPPSDLHLPVTVLVDKLTVEQARLPGLDTPVEQLTARLEAGAQSHRIEALNAHWKGLQIDGSARIQTDAPLALRVSVAVHTDDDAPGTVLPLWTRGLALTLDAQGPLARLDTQAKLALQAQRLDATARITPFEKLPLSSLDARFAQLDLAPLLMPFTTVTPTTSLTGTAELQLAPDAPLVVKVQAANEVPGRWDLQHLPVHEFELTASGSGGNWRIQSARVQLASDARTPAGKLHGSGSFLGGVAEATLTLDKVDLQSLDRRAPALALSGPVHARHTPPPSGANPTPPSATPGPAFGRVDFDMKLGGALLGQARRGKGLPRPLRGKVQLDARGHATPDEAVLDKLDAQAGSARLAGKARVKREARRWAAQADLQLARFDPALWLPATDAAWLRARNALNGHVTLQARVPRAASSTAALLTALRGSLRADLADSVLAGQPLALNLQADADGAGLITAKGHAEAVGNVATLDARLRAVAHAGAGQDEYVELHVDAPSLAKLARVADTLGIAALSGAAKIDGRVEGPIGAVLLSGAGKAGGPLTTRGSLQLDALHVAGTSVEHARGQWDATLPAGDVRRPAAATALARAALSARLDATQLRLPGALLPSVALQADGSLAEHRATLHATIRQSPASKEAGAPPPPAPLALDATLSGNWQAGTAKDEPALWRARLAELSLRPLTKASASGAAAPASASAASAPALNTEREPAPGAPLPLFVARDVTLALRHGPGLLDARVEPGRAEVLGASLRWSQLQWIRRDGAAPRLDVQAEVEPFVVSTLLRRLQPDFGWAGDLRLGARIDVHSNPDVTAHVEIARTGGDLQINEFGVVQALQLSDARVALDVQGGTWRATELIAGANLGRIEGQQSLRTDPTLLWPAPQAPLQGNLNVHVENLAAWGVWVPAGWRLGGRLDASLRLGGTFGAPELVGEMHGRELALRNALEGVALTDGVLDARFEGNTARLTTLRFAAGEGELHATGTARLGSQPQAQIQLTLDHALLLGRVDRRVAASGNVSATLDARRIAVNGKLRVDEGLIDISRGDAPSLSDDVTVRRAGDTRAEDDEAAAAGGAPREIDLHLAIDLGSKLRLKGRGIDTRLEGQLQFTSPNDKLAVNGEIRTVDGTYEAYGQKLDIDHGVITFVGDLANPRLDIEAVRAHSDVRVGVRVSGNVRTPRVALFSDPELPATDKLALLVTGRSSESLGGADTLLLQRAALALLAGDGSGASNFDIAKALKLDELSVRQTDDGAVHDTVVTLGKQISDRVYLGYERGLNAAAGNWQLIYRIAQRFTVRAQSGDDPAVDFIWLFRWN